MTSVGKSLLGNGSLAMIFIVTMIFSVLTMIKSRPDDVKGYVLSDREKTGLTMLGATSFFHPTYSTFSNCLLGVHFKADEWGHKRCGSVCGDYNLPLGFTILHRECFPGSGR